MKQVQFESISSSPPLFTAFSLIKAPEFYSSFVNPRNLRKNFFFTNLDTGAFGPFLKFVLIVLSSIATVKKDSKVLLNFSFSKIRGGNSNICESDLKKLNV